MTEKELTIIKALVEDEMESVNADEPIVYEYLSDLAAIKEQLR